MTVHSGKFGIIDSQAAVGNWSIEETYAPARYRASNTRGGTQRIAGIKDFTGSFTQYLGLPSVLPGELFRFQGYVAPTDDAYGSNGFVYDSGASGAIVESVSIAATFAEGEPSITSTVNFANASSTGLSHSSTTALTDSGTTLPTAVCSLLVKTGASGYETTWANWTSWTLNITSENPSTVNASTNCWRIRKAGPIDWTLAVTEDEEQQLLTLGSDYRILLYTTASNYWELKWGHLESYTGLTVDINTGAIVSKTANFGMVAHDGSALGAITKPGGGNLWPPT